MQEIIISRQPRKISREIDNYAGIVTFCYQVNICQNHGKRGKSADQIW